MDRYTVNTAKSQIGFIDVIVIPMYEVIKAFLPILQNYIGNLENNKTKWKEKIEEYDEKLSIFLFFHFFLKSSIQRLFQRTVQ
jgi:hypothetical protein